VSSRYSESEARTIRSFVRERKRQQRSRLAARLEAARKDFEAVVAMIVASYDPARIYQWGSLLEERHFSEISDIDLAVEGITDPASLSAMRADAERLTAFPLDIVAIEHIHPAYAEHIRRRGRIVYERKSPGS
jgi:predicted nucleotidyltransferase